MAQSDISEVIVEFKDWGFLNRLNFCLDVLLRRITAIRTENVKIAYKNDKKFYTISN